MPGTSEGYKCIFKLKILPTCCWVNFLLTLVCVKPEGLFGPFDKVVSELELIVFARVDGDHMVISIAQGLQVLSRNPITTLP